eukprot:520513-Rhodomonas_salina.1
MGQRVWFVVLAVVINTSVLALLSMQVRPTAPRNPIQETAFSVQTAPGMWFFAVEFAVYDTQCEAACKCTTRACLSRTPRAGSVRLLVGGFRGLGARLQNQGLTAAVSVQFVLRTRGTQANTSYAYSVSPSLVPRVLLTCAYALTC